MRINNINEKYFMNEINAKGCYTKENEPYTEDQATTRVLIEQSVIVHLHWDAAGGQIRVLLRSVRINDSSFTRRKRYIYNSLKWIKLEKNKYFIEKCRGSDAKM